MQLSLSSASSLPTEQMAMVTYVYSVIVIILVKYSHGRLIYTHTGGCSLHKMSKGIKRWISTSQRRSECIRHHIRKPVVTLTFDHWPPKSKQFINRGLWSFPISVTEIVPDVREMWCSQDRRPGPALTLTFDLLNSI